MIVPLELSMEASVSADGISPVIRTKDGERGQRKD